ncbi:hypothetical protein GT204_26730 [Streptomyces sp. SID4919]|uniref:hypothetical protein n=1 Tax=unclassified Streptomyces TaxID=2593676 RepID=UPI0008238AB0|nr:MULTISPECIES: hypothetical protein [unclassified Streptomyces]MYY12403.1 hypothetical protein [Streptomyces sp. SID4919]SCK54349.1 hypothetical protein YW7DRAFT_04988 [Streptomyces sp. AmelKG-E11A]
MRGIRSRTGGFAVLAVIVVGGTGVAVAIQPESQVSGSGTRQQAEPRVDYTGVIKGPSNANVRKVKDESQNNQLWGLVYNTETVRLACKGVGGGATWYQLAGQPNRWIVDYKLEKLTPGIPNCP